ncbi:hypothetical protein CAOG_08466 [Capsaspora owczarzaki ATCC 30864]|uniref:DUF4442 domain-containing protein n=1 Tax=Capsaspora owczarzaki (strain ATCC 30864) TaxID=595528 RepID=A0A0D2VI79_CAPO3|nr:hypothetical protein CAOG_08466 [Capsaspora owczarzaki ATCC 30864]KJE89632.1 hypothetical protein CAOG_008466 [Capsaspora owczarzaki ATCC 30864]|eukprot:XP_011270038.1 hypothetical protein CAOG_08466 [Capsaspora owczarzaki ATCC 30864]
MTVTDVAATAVLYPLFLVFGVLQFIVALVINTPALVAWALSGKAKRRFLESLWGAVHKQPLGRELISTLMGILSTYTGSVSPFIAQVDATETLVQLTERPWLRNPFTSIHALAIANAAELASGLLATRATEHFGGRVIVTNISVAYDRKARGVISCHAQLTPEQVRQVESMASSAQAGKPVDESLVIQVNVLDSKKEIVSRLQATWVVRVSGGKRA